MIYNVFMTKCINMRMSLNETDHMYTITARLHIMFYMRFHTRRTNMPMSMNKT